MRLLHLTEVPLPLCGPGMLHCEEVSSPKTIDIKQYLSTSNLSVNNRHFVIKNSNKKMLILKRFVTKSVFSCDDDN
jgi:hypothetical protein